jgi:YidC/Oxa1 family membrane protein insertase
MNNQRPAMGEQLLRSLLLSLAAMWIISHFFGWPGQPKNSSTARPANLTAIAASPDAVARAFAGINPAQGTPLDATAAKAEIATLQKQIAENSSDPYSYWARLRTGLLQQYVLKDMRLAFGQYDDIIYHAAHDAIDAQAIFQKGDWQWRRAEASESGQPYAALSANPTALDLALRPSKQDAVWTLEQLFHRGRNSAGFLNTKILVPKIAANNGAKSTLVSLVPLESVPAQGFEEKKMTELRGTLVNPHPLGILDRINAFYSTKPLNRSFDALVNFFGAKPSYSYGLAIMVLALLLRVLLQPVNRKQYDSMKGMQKIAPEMKKIQDKYKVKPNDSPEVQRDKQMKMFSEVRAMQKAEGVNPQLGCLLAFVQIPIFFYIINPLMMHYEPKMELVGANFLWIESLARPDYILLALYGLSMLVSFRLSATPPTDEMQRQMQVMTTFVFPIMLPFFMKGFSSAFILYWMMFNFVSMIFQYRMMKANDPNKTVMKALIGEPLFPKLPVDESKSEAVPPRPKSNGKKTAKAVTPPLTIIKSGEENGSAGKNGTGNNGAAKKETLKNGASKNTVNKNGANKNGAALNGEAQNGAPDVETNSEAVTDGVNADTPANGDAPANGAPRRNREQSQRARRRRR